MVATSQDVIAFKALFPALAKFGDADISGAFGLADVMTDANAWSNPTTYRYARFLWTANQLVIMAILGQTTLGLASSMSSSVGLTPAGLGFLRDVRFGERSVSFEQYRLFNQTAMNSGPIDAALGYTIYGLEYQGLRNREFPAVLVV
jgi:hypothetical protein